VVLPFDAAGKKTSKIGKTSGKAHYKGEKEERKFKKQRGWFSGPTAGKEQPTSKKSANRRELGGAVYQSHINPEDPFKRKGRKRT